MSAHELPIPPAAADDADARELVRVWAASGAQHVTIATGVWEDPAAWGLASISRGTLLAPTLARTEARRTLSCTGSERDSTRSGPPRRTHPRDAWAANDSFLLRRTVARPRDTHPQQIDAAPVLASERLGGRRERAAYAPPT
jgi:hypothetical protein